MTAPKHRYSFSSTNRGADFRRIVDENPNSEVIVLSENGKSPATLVRVGTEADARLHAAGRVAMGHFYSQQLPFKRFAVYNGDLHSVALAVKTFSVEVY